MSQQKTAAPAPSLSLQDILYVLFKHKGKILLSAAIGISAALAVYLVRPRVYESQAKLLVRYVVDRSAIDPLDSRATERPSSDNLINSEVEILASWDLAMQVTKAVGVERLLPKYGNTANNWELARRLFGAVGSEQPSLQSGDAIDTAKAARNILLGLTVSALKGTNIIFVSYRNRDPELATLVLNELVTRYFTKHLEVHRSADAFDFVTQQTDQVRAQLNQTEQELKRLKASAGITSLAESTANLNAEQAKTRGALQAAEAQQAEQQALVRELEKSFPAQDKNFVLSPPEVKSEVVQYQALVSRVANLRQMDLDLFSKYAQKPDKPEAIDESLRNRPVRGQASTVIPRPRSMGFAGSERDLAQTIARERYRRQNDTGFDYQGGKKSFDTLVKEAEQEILSKKSNDTQDEKASQDQLVRLNELQKMNRMQIENVEKQLSDMEKKFPDLAVSLPVTPSENSPSDALERTRVAQMVVERARLAGMEARVEMLKSHLSDMEKQVEQLSEIGPQIVQLERTKELEENNYKYFQASLEKARVDEALDPSKMPNISAVQKPSPAMRATGNVKKAVLGLAVGGVGFGLALAFVIELLVDRTVRRPLEIEALLGIPLLFSIPYFNGRKHARLGLSHSGQKSIVALRETGHPNAAPWDSGHFIRPFCEAIRDRLVLFFELNPMRHKPKLVAVTGYSEGAGTSTISSGLAAALSETGDKVLLVDMNVGRPEVHPFFRGTPACSLAEALVGAPSPAGENLYLAVATPPDGRQAQLIPKRFYDLMPHLKASGFDYIIFDMPPLSQTSITPAMSGLMDKMLVLVEAEKSDRDFVMRAYAELIACRTSVSVIFNKVRSYMPKGLGAEG